MYLHAGGVGGRSSSWRTDKPSGWGCGGLIDVQILELPAAADGIYLGGEASRDPPLQLPHLACFPFLSEIMLTYNLSASVEGISGEARGTGACGIVINNLAARLDATSARTRVHALLVLAIEVLGTVGANDALGPAVGSRSDEALLAGADGMAVDLPTLTVRTAGRGLARVFI